MALSAEDFDRIALNAEERAEVYEEFGMSGSVAAAGEVARIARDIAGRCR